MLQRDRLVLASRVAGRELGLIDEVQLVADELRPDRLGHRLLGLRDDEGGHSVVERGIDRNN